MDLGTLQKITIYAIPAIFAITIHEAAHAFAARYFGDSTAYMLGRMTWNPAKHIDPIWTILVPLVSMLSFGFIFGAAKPVPVNFNALRRPKQHMIWVAAAGPSANLLMLFGWAVVLKLATYLGDSGPAVFLRLVAEAGTVVNALLMIFNLFPLLPLDGGRIVAGLLPRKAANAFSRMEPYGIFILVGLIFLESASGVPGPIRAFLWPLVDFSMNAVYSLLSLR